MTSSPRGEGRKEERGTGKEIHANLKKTTENGKRHGGTQF